MPTRIRHPLAVPHAHGPPLATTPRLVRGGGEERHATWLELFFDLVFVVAVAQVAHTLEADLTMHGLLIYAAMFVPVWWLWIDFSYYADQFDSGLSLKLTLLGVMFGVIVLSLTLPHGEPGESARFALVYMALRVVIIALYLRARRHVPEARELAGRYALSFGIALGVWAVSLLVAEPLRYWLWGLALAIEIFNGPVTYLTIKDVPQQDSHMDERFGLFALIVLGEAVLAVATAMSGIDWSVPAMAAGFAGFVAACCLWWIYFSGADASVIKRSLSSGRWGLFLAFVYGYSHLFVFAGIAAAGVGVEGVLHALDEGHAAGFAGTVMFAGAAAFLFAVSAVHWSGPHTADRRIVGGRLLAAAACVAVAPFAPRLPPLALMLGLAAGLTALAWSEFGWFHQDARAAEAAGEVELAAAPAHGG